MEYEYNEETDGICSISEFLRHSCTKCPKKGKCDEIVKAHYEEIENNENSSGLQIHDTKRIYKR